MRPERGAALLVALLATVVIALAGGAYLALTSAESRIARNETVSVQARYAAEAGARAVRAWFERPGSAPGFPQDPAQVLRQRRLLNESDPYGPPLPDSGPEYKEGIDLDGDGRDDLFGRPFRGVPLHALLGTEQHPDLRIEDEGFLDRFSRTLFGNFPGSGLRARLRQILVHAPPYVRRDDAWVRHGTGTIRVVAGIYRDGIPGWAGALAERTATIVVSETPYRASLYGPVHSCGDLTLLGDVGVRWGALTAAGEILGLVPENGLRTSLPRAPAVEDGSDRLWTDDPDWLAEFSASLDPTEPLWDPWLRVLAGGPVAGSPSSAEQPYAGVPPPAPGTPAPWACCDRSNVFQHQSWVGCPDYDYRLWKRVSRSGFRGVHYYSPDSHGGFFEDGVGPSRTFEQIFAGAAGEPGLYFFDTADRRPPRDGDGDGEPDNLTPEIHVGPGWRARGFVFLHAERFVSAGLDDSLDETFRPPGEPFVGAPDAWVDLQYPTNLEAPFYPGGPAEWSSRGPAIEGSVAFRGILVNGGRFEVSGAGTFYGSVVAGGIALDGSTVPANRFYWDASLAQGWPPDGWDLPRLVITSVGFE